SGPALLQLLARTAPTWLLQMPWLVAEATRHELERELRLSSRERMVRELIEFVEALAATTPLVLLLEDLHWSDPATLGLLAARAPGGHPPAARTPPAGPRGGRRGPRGGRRRAAPPCSGGRRCPAPTSPRWSPRACPPPPAPPGSRKRSTAAPAGTRCSSSTCST